MPELTSEARARGLMWALRDLEDAASRYPDIEEILRRARGPQHLLDRFIRSITKRAMEEGLTEAQMSGVLASVVGIWLRESGTEVRERRRNVADALDDRRAAILKATEELLKQLRRNEGALGAEVGLDLRTLPVSTRFPGLMRSLEELALWVERETAGPPEDRGGAASVQHFVQQIDEALGFKLENAVLADLWELLNQSETTADAVRKARTRTNPP